jgi:putative hydrolase of the HAD superfamily
VIHALFLDAAGTLIEPAEPVAEVYHRAAAAQGLALPVAEIQSAFRQVFCGLPDPAWAAHADGDAAEREWWLTIVGRTLTVAGGAPVADGVVRACFEVLFAHYEEAAAWHVFPEVREVLEAARRRGWKCAVVSNFDRRLHRILAGHDLKFDAVVTSADARSRKPDPAIFLHALELLGLSPDEVIHAGDSRTADAGGATAAKIRSFILDRPHNDLRELIFIAESL